MSGFLEDFFWTPIPDEVWHYTTLAGFEGILSSGRIWATEAHFTRDESEFIHVRDVAEEYLSNLAPTDIHAERAKDTALKAMGSAFDEGALSSESTEVFVASFSAAKDLKSQWHEYADQYRGVSLSLNLSKVRPAQHLGFAITFAPCVYLQEQKIRLVEAALAHLISKVSDRGRDSVSPDWADRRLCDWIQVDNIYGIPFDQAALNAAMKERLAEEFHLAQIQTTFDLLRVASHCKDLSYFQESEWRLALPHSKSKPLLHDTVLYRGPEHKTPFIAHSLFNDRLPIVQVMAGPLCEDASHIKDILHKYGYDNVPISQSKVPIRRP